MTTQETDPFKDELPSHEDGAVWVPILKPWHRIVLCLGFLALMVVYAKWLLES